MNKQSITTLFWISLIVSILSFFLLNNTQEKTIENFLTTFVISSVYCFVLGIGNGVVNDFLTKKFSWIDQTTVRVATGIAGALLVNVFGVLLINYLINIQYFKNDPAKFFQGQMMVSNVITIAIALLIAAVLHAKDFMEEWKKSAKQQVTEQKIIAKSANAQFESLKNQLDPHFLFNSLNVLSALIDENPNQAQQFTSSMSKVYRYVLDQKDKELVTVEEELDFAKTYCELLKTRFEDAVDFQFEVSNEAQKMYVVPLSLQLLLENAIKHNYATSGKPLMIKIYSENNQLIIKNNLQQREIVKDREGIGLANIVQRYALLTKENVTIDQSNEKFKVKIPMLTEKISEMKTEIVKNTDYQRAAARVKELKSFYTSLIVFAAVIAFLAYLNFSGNSSRLWFLWVAGFWGFALTMRAVKIFIFGNNWEEKKIKEVLNKE